MGGSFISYRREDQRPLHHDTIETRVGMSLSCSEFRKLPAILGPWTKAE